MFVDNEGNFLILLQDNNLENFRAIIRKPRFKPCGQYAFANVSVKGHTLNLSGDYGEMGLPLTVGCSWNSEETNAATIAAYEVAVPLPDSLQETWGKGQGGHNCAGSEAPEMRNWARYHKNALKYGKRGTFKVEYILQFDEETNEPEWHTSKIVFHHKKDAEAFIKPMPENRQAKIVNIEPKRCCH